MTKGKYGHSTSSGTNCPGIKLPAGCHKANNMTNLSTSGWRRQEQYTDSTFQEVLIVPCGQ